MHMTKQTKMPKIKEKMPRGNGRVATEYTPPIAAAETILKIEMRRLNTLETM